MLTGFRVSGLIGDAHSCPLLNISRLQHDIDPRASAGGEFSPSLLSVYPEYPARHRRRRFPCCAIRTNRYNSVRRESSGLFLPGDR